MKKEKHDGEVLQDIISKLGMDNTSFGLLAVFSKKKLLDTAESFNLTKREKQVGRQTKNCEGRQPKRCNGSSGSSQQSPHHARKGDVKGP